MVSKANVFIQKPFKYDCVANVRDQQTVATGLSAPKDADARLLHRLVRHRLSLPSNVLRALRIHCAAISASDTICLTIASNADPFTFMPRITPLWSIR